MTRSIRSRERFAGAEILDLQRVLAEAGGVEGVGEQMVVVADVEGAEARKGWPCGEGVQVEEDFFGGIRRHRAGGSGSGTACLLRCARNRDSREGGRERKVGLLDAAEHLLVELFLKRLRCRRERRRCRRFRR